MEICIDSIESAKNAISGGARRLEVCSSLSEGGLSPTPGLVKIIRNHDGNIKIYAMIRIRSGNFVYTRDEMDAMLYDVEILKKQGVDGFVFGALREDSSLHSDYCREILTAAKPKPVTFHRAFDLIADPSASLEKIIELGFERILTSGGRDTAIEGLEAIAGMIRQAADRIIVMPGSGIDPSNVETIVRRTGAKEIHASARKLLPILAGGAARVRIGASADDDGRMVTSAESVNRMVRLVQESSS